ncbi:MAG: TRAPP III-specific subunit 85 family protein [Spirochaetia bacterium]|nr:TRAPP III-specific subunit 85 family protein [Spirochaetia bacterium]
MKKVILTVLIFLIAASAFAAGPGSLPKVEAFYIKMADYSFEFGKYKYAYSLYEQAAKMNSGNIYAYIGTGKCMKMFKQDREADRFYARAKELYPTFEPPDLKKYRVLDKERRKDTTEHKRKYKEMAEKVYNKKKFTISKEMESSLYVGDGGSEPEDGQIIVDPELR